MKHPVSAVLCAVCITVGSTTSASAPRAAPATVETLGLEEFDNAARSRIGALDALGEKTRARAISRWNEFARRLAEYQRPHELEDGASWRLELTRFTGTRVLPRVQWKLVLSVAGVDSVYAPPLQDITLELVGGTSQQPFAEWTQRRAVVPWVQAVHLGEHPGALMLVGVELVREEETRRSEFSPKRLGFAQLFDRQGGALKPISAVAEVLIDSIRSTGQGDEVRTRGAFLGVDAPSSDCPVAWQPFVIAGPQFALIAPAMAGSKWGLKLADPSECARARSLAKKGDAPAGATAFACDRSQDAIPSSADESRRNPHFPSACSFGPWLDRWIHGSPFGGGKER